MKKHDLHFLRRMFIYSLGIALTVTFLGVMLVRVLKMPEHMMHDRFNLQTFAKIVNSKNLCEDFKKQKRSVYKCLLESDLIDNYNIEDHMAFFSGKKSFTVARSKIRVKRGKNFLMLTKLENSEYLAYFPPPPPGIHPTTFLYLISAIILLSMLVSFLFFYIKMKGFGNELQSVVSEIHGGNLKARFGNKKQDAFSKSMQMFNEMADEIEHLFQKIKDSEEVRINVLQELSHDLKTPVASLKNLLETLKYGENLKDKEKEELHELALNEVDYFETLVGDLLTWAIINEPKYQVLTEKIDLNELLEYEIQRFKSLSSNVKVSYVSETGESMLGNIFQIKRLFRNLFDNALEYTKKSLEIKLILKEDLFIIDIHDDGKGFTPEQINQYGKKKFSRVAQLTSTKKISIGLGSVIVLSILKNHRGDIHLENRDGAYISITLPKN